jgi:hypothetical protein
MNNLFIFLFKISLVFSVLYIVYKLILSRHTFHQLNRVTLLLIIPFSIFIASTKIVIPIETKNIEIPSFVEIWQTSENISINENQIETAVVNAENSSYLIYLYLLSVLSYAFIIFTSILKLYRLKKKSTVTTKGKYKIIYADVTNPFSCFNWIFIPKNQQHHKIETILEHEQKHVDFNHTFDLLLTELFIAFFWFNPIVYFYRKSIKSIHEYQADMSVINDQNIHILQYLQLIRKEIENSTNSNLYSYFGQPILKKRIQMMTKSTTRNIHKIKYLLILPFVFLSMVSFTKENTIIPIIHNLSNSKPSISPIKNITKKDITAKYGKMKHPILKSTRQHNGIDIRAAVGTPIVATADGTIVNASYEGKWGNLIIIEHENGYQTLYAHLNRFNCKKNQTVKKGEIIGYSGETGMVTGPHLHYSIKLNGDFINPINYIE